MGLWGWTELSFTIQQLFELFEKKNEKKYIYLFLSTTTINIKK